MKKSNSDVIFDLSSVLYYLHVIDSLYSNDSYQKILDEYRLNSSGQEIERIIVALEWALNNKDYDFRQVLPNIEYSNVQIITFMERLFEVLKKAFDSSTLTAMKTPIDLRNLRILVLDDLKYDHTEVKFAHTNYITYESHNPSEAIREYLEDAYDLFILNFNQSGSKLWNFLIDLAEAKSRKADIKTPVLILLDDENAVSVENLHEFGFQDHLPLPVPTYILLQVTYRLTLGNLRSHP